MTALDEAYERMAASGFELPNGFVNHGPMACEALAALGCDEAIDGWARRFAHVGGHTVEPRPPASGHAFDWQASLGDYDRLPDWIGLMEKEIDQDGWRPVVARWVPRLLPALATALFHGAIRASHAVRAIDDIDSAPRRAELARSLGYWAARWRPGATAEPGTGNGNANANGAPGATTQAADAAAYYLADPNILNLHGVTGSMAVDLLGSHLAPADQVVGLSQLRADLSQLHRRADVAVAPDPSGPADFHELAAIAAASRDPHQVKLVEACQRAFAATGEPVFEAAAVTVSSVRSYRPPR
jgi:hypothetical protein